MFCLVKVSVVIAVYNVENYLKKCLDSVINQTLEDIEIICVDDGSTDNSPNILNDYKNSDNRIQVIRQENQGRSGATNTGLKYVTGDYIFFVDSDDWIELTALEKLYNNAIENDSDLVLYDSIEHFSENQTNIRDFYLLKDLTNEVFTYKDEKQLVLNSYFVPWAKLYKTSFFKKHNLKFHNFLLFVDISLTVPATLLAERITYLPEVLYHYNRLNQSSMQNTKIKSNRSKVIFELIDFVENFLNENNFFKELELNFLKFKISQPKVMFDNLNEDSKDEFYQLLRKCFFSIDSSAKLISKLPLEFYSFFIHVITFDTYEQYKVVNHYKNNINELFFEYLNKNDLDLKLKDFNTVGINDESDIIVSLTSFPERINEVPYTIYSLLNQNLKPKKVILWLASEEFPNKEDDIPSILLNLKNNGLEIKWCENLISYKKLIPSLKEYPDNIIATADDDVFYADTWLESLYNSYLENPNSIICTRSRKIKINDDNTFDKYVNWPVSESSEDASYLNLFTGVGGVLYPSNSLNHEVLNYDVASKLCPHADDLWFWAMAVLNKTKIVKIDFKNPTSLNIYRSLEFSDDKRLFELNINKNDEQIKNIINEFPKILEVIGDEK
ncbi:MAG: glycosyltransferase [Methanobrevibacter millerae]|uniref:Glycosyltransferase n=1 Tax=Methanobrevibacter millerae TaxID=230361 RepID=A0A8T3VJ59_9EURY|nr:glycosyltransferase [Methanobrevibacter millerae]